MAVMIMVQILMALVGAKMIQREFSRAEKRGYFTEDGGYVALFGMMLVIIPLANAFTAL